MITQEQLAERIRNELLPISRTCAEDVLYDLYIADDQLHMSIMQAVIDEYIEAFAGDVEEVDGYRRNM